MYKYVLKRLLMLIPVIIGVSFLVFFIMSLSPGDPPAPSSVRQPPSRR